MSTMALSQMCYYNIARSATLSCLASATTCPVLTLHRDFCSSEFLTLAVTETSSVQCAENHVQLTLAPRHAMPQGTLITIIGLNAML